MRLASKLVLAAGLALASCGNDPNAGFGFRTAMSLVRGVLKPGVTAAPQQVTLTRDMLRTVTTPLLLVRVEKTGATGTMALAAGSPDSRTWLSADGISITTRGGLLAATRGFGGDLLSAETAPLAAALRADRGHYSRAVEHLDGENLVRETHLDCEVTSGGRTAIEVVEKTYRVRLLTETCRSGTDTLTSQFWIDGSGQVRQSRQWVSKAIGMVFVQQLVD